MLSAGTRLGAYEIISVIGAGGMGEVYKGRDTRLDRTVALKVLPSAHAADTERNLRFEREARAISSLNHPHICALYDVGVHDGLQFLVMEYLEGETLEERLRKGPLPIEEALRLGVQMADALDQAHRQGIIHRDLKPANVILTRGGIKLLDFGLAKALEPAAARTRRLSRRYPDRSQRRAPSSGPFSTCRRSNWKVPRRTCAATSSLSAPCSTRCSPEKGHFREGARQV